jgi:hypothetical protein
VKKIKLHALDHHTEYPYMCKEQRAQQDAFLSRQTRRVEQVGSVTNTEPGVLMYDMFDPGQVMNRLRRPTWPGDTLYLLWQTL